MAVGRNSDAQDASLQYFIIFCTRADDHKYRLYGHRTRLITETEIAIVLSVVNSAYFIAFSYHLNINYNFTQKISASTRRTRSMSILWNLLQQKAIFDMDCPFLLLQLAYQTRKLFYRIPFDLIRNNQAYKN